MRAGDPGEPPDGGLSPVDDARQPGPIGQARALFALPSDIRNRRADGLPAPGAPPPGGDPAGRPATSSNPVVVAVRLPNLSERNGNRPTVMRSVGQPASVAASLSGS